MYLDARYPSPKDRVAFVAGGASGIGAGVAELNFIVDAGWT